MGILELHQLPNETPVKFQGLISELKPLTTKAEKPYLHIYLQDNTGKIDFPIWDNFPALSHILEAGLVVEVSGKITRYDDSVQIKNPEFIIQSGEVNYDLFVPSYVIPQAAFNYFDMVMKYLDKPYQTLATAATGWGGYDKKRWKAFTTCVSAEKHHGNKRGGLFLHTIGVMQNIDMIISSYIVNTLFYNAKDVINPSRLRFKAIMHDIKKPEEYDYDGIIRRKPNKIRDHMLLGVAYLDEINDECGKLLTEDEIEDVVGSILSHHGHWGSRIVKHEPQTLEDWLLHIADLTDARIVGAIEDTKGK